MSAPVGPVRAVLEEYAFPLEREFLARPFAALVPRLAAVRA